MTKKQKEKCNRLAALFYKMQGCDVPDGYDFSRAKHPQEISMWNFAETAFMFWKEFG